MNNLNNIFMQKRKELYEELDQLCQAKQKDNQKYADIILKYVKQTLESIKKPYFRPQEINVSNDINSLCPGSNTFGMCTLTTSGTYTDITFENIGDKKLPEDFHEETISTLLKDYGINVESYIEIINNNTKHLHLIITYLPVLSYEERHL